MENVSRPKYNNLSERLREEVKKAMPKPGQTIWFKNLRPTSRGSTVLSVDRIYDPWAVKLENGKYEGEFIDIAYITGQTPGKGEVFGRIQFARSKGNAIGIRGGNTSDERQFTYLFLTNSSKSNIDKPWFVKNSGRPFVFGLVQPELTAKAKQERRRKVVMAFETIDKMGKEELFDFASGLDFKGINKFSNEDEIRAKLGDIAEKDPEKILRLNSDVGLKLTIKVKEAEQLGVIRLNSQLGVYEWPDTGDQICMVPPGKNPREVLVGFLMTDRGSDTLRYISNLVDDMKNKKKESKEEKVAKEEKVVKPKTQKAEA